MARYGIIVLFVVFHEISSYSIDLPQLFTILYLKFV